MNSNFKLKKIKIWMVTPVIYYEFKFKEIWMVTPVIYYEFKFQIKEIWMVFTTDLDFSRYLLDF